MSEPKVTVVIDFPETPGDFHPVIGRSGLHIGLALHDSTRGHKVLRLPLEQFRKVREDIFGCKRNGQFPIPDFEVELEGNAEEAEAANAAEAEKLKSALKEIESLRAKLAEAEAEIAALKAAAAEPAAKDPKDPTDLSDQTDLSDLPPPGETPPTPSKDPLTPSEAGAILGNGIPEPEDTEAAKILAAQAAGKSEPEPEPGKETLTRAQKAAATRAANKAKKAGATK